MNKTLKHLIMAALTLSLGLAASVTQAQASADRVYAIDGRNEVIMSGSNLCWRTGFWTPAGAAKDPAGCKCDKDILEKSVCEPKRAPETKPGSKGPAVTPLKDKVSIPAEALFDFNKSDLKPEGKKALDKVVAQAESINLEVVIAVGHADRIGGKAYNQKLSERRANSVKNYLISKGIPANRLYTEGKGSSQPKTAAGECKGAKSKKVIACLQRDRRVDVEVIGTKK